MMLDGRRKVVDCRVSPFFFPVHFVCELLPRATWLLCRKRCSWIGKKIKKRNTSKKKMNNIVRRIFADRKRPADLTDEQYDAYLQQQFPTWITEFENNGFLEATKLPPISSEDELLAKLHQHRDQLVVLKYWKHGCLPCLSMAEMYKDAEKQTQDPSHPLYKKVVWYSVSLRRRYICSRSDFRWFTSRLAIQRRAHC